MPVHQYFSLPACTWPDKTRQEISHSLLVIVDFSYQFKDGKVYIECQKKLHTYTIKPIFQIIQHKLLISKCSEDIDLTFAKTHFLIGTTVKYDFNKLQCIWYIIPSFPYRGNSVHLHECSPFWVGILITFNKENYHVYCLM